MGAHACHDYNYKNHALSPGEAMSLDEEPPPPRVDWTAQRVFLGRPVYVWQLNLAALLAVLFVAFVGFSFSGPFLPLLVRHLGVTEPGAVAIWSGVLIGLGPLSAVVASPLWGRLADRIGGSAPTPADGLWLCGRSMRSRPWPPMSGSSPYSAYSMGALGGFTAVALTLASLSAPPEQTTRAIALVQSAQILGQMVGPAFGGLMADHWGIRAAFWGSSALAVVAGLNMLLMYQEAPAYTQQRRQRQTSGARMRFRDLLQTPGFAPLLVVLFVGTFANRSYQPLIPLFVASTGSCAGGGGVRDRRDCGRRGTGGDPLGQPGESAGGAVPHAQVLVVALSACAAGSGLLVCSHTALQFGLLRVAVGLFDGSILTRVVWPGGGGDPG